MFLKAPKAALASALYRTGLLGIGGVGVNGRLIVFNYHRISPGLPDFEAPFDGGVYGPSPDVFEEQVKWLQKNTRVLSEPELLEIVSQKDKTRYPSELCSSITFDDGYLDNYTLAYPILKRLGAPATFFIPSHLIQSRTVGWWDSIAYLLKRTQKTAIHWNGDVYSLRDRADVAKLFNNKMAAQPAAETRDLVDRLADACGEPLPDAQLQSSQLMNWDQIREMSRDMTIGSHSHTHTVFATMDAAAQKEDMALSKSILEREIGKPVASIAYPVGGYEHFTGETQKAAAECGFRIAFSFATGTNSWPDVNRLAIARVSSPVTMSLTVAKARIPQFFALK
jgi:peptidoglycan/xylan/chitin deacetylase (PgdA/CDA1 family)